MCYNVHTSAFAALVGFTSAVCAGLMGHLVVAVFVATYTTVQIAEGLVWHSLDNRDVGLNRRGTALLVGSLSVHALTTVLAALFYIHSLSHEQDVLYKARNASRTMVVMLALAAVAGAVQWHNRKPQSTTQAVCQDDDWDSPWLCRLHWRFQQSNTLALMSYTLQVLVIATTMYIIYGGTTILRFFLFVYASTLLLSVVVMLSAYKRFSISIKRAVSIGVSTLWCFFSAIAAPVFVFGLWYVG